MYITNQTPLSQIFRIKLEYFTLNDGLETHKFLKVYSRGAFESFSYSATRYVIVIKIVC